MIKKILSLILILTFSIQQVAFAYAPADSYRDTLNINSPLDKGLSPKDNPYIPENLNAAQIHQVAAATEQVMPSIRQIRQEIPDARQQDTAVSIVIALRLKLINPALVELAHTQARAALLKLNFITPSKVDQAEMIDAWVRHATGEIMMATGPEGDVSGSALAIGVDGKQYAAATADQSNIEDSNRRIAQLRQEIEREGRQIAAEQGPVVATRWLLNRLIAHSNCSDPLFRANMPPHMQEVPGIAEMLAQRLGVEATPETLIACMLHDADRFFDGYYVGIADEPGVGSDAYVNYFKPIQHPAMAADFVRPLLEALGIDEAMVRRVDVLVRNHETRIAENVANVFVARSQIEQGDVENVVLASRLLMEADAISVFTPQLLANVRNGLRSEGEFHAAVVGKYGRCSADGRAVIDEVMQQRRDELLGLEGGADAYRIFEEARADIISSQLPGVVFKAPARPPTLGPGIVAVQEGIIQKPAGPLGVRAVTIDPRQAQLGIHIDSEGPSYDCERNAPEPIATALGKEAKDHPGSTIHQFVATPPAGVEGEIVFATCADQFQFQCPNTLYVINGRPVTKTAPGILQSREHFEANKGEDGSFKLDGIFHVFVLDAEKVGVRTVRFKDGKVTEGRISDIGMGVAGPTVVVGGNAAVENIQYAGDGQAALDGNQVLWDPNSRLSSFSMLGKDPNGNIVHCVVSDLQLKAELGRGILVGELPEIAQSLGLTDVILLGGSFDAVQHVSGVEGTASLELPATIVSSSGGQSQTQTHYEQKGGRSFPGTLYVAAGPQTEADRLLAQGGDWAMDRFYSGDHSFLRNHAMRVTRIGLLIARRMGLSQEEQTLLVCASLLHDMGALGMSEQDKWQELRYAHNVNYPGQLLKSDLAGFLAHYDCPNSPLHAIRQQHAGNDAALAEAIEQSIPAIVAAKLRSVCSTEELDLLAVEGVLEGTLEAAFRHGERGGDMLAPIVAEVAQGLGVSEELVREAAPIVYWHSYPSRMQAEDINDTQRRVAYALSVADSIESANSRERAEWGFYQRDVETLEDTLRWQQRKVAEGDTTQAAYDAAEDLILSEDAGMRAILLEARKMDPAGEYPDYDRQYVVDRRIANRIENELNRPAVEYFRTVQGPLKVGVVFSTWDGDFVTPGGEPGLVRRGETIKQKAQQLQRLCDAKPDAEFTLYAVYDSVKEVGALEEIIHQFEEAGVSDRVRLAPISLQDAIENSSQLSPGEQAVAGSMQSADESVKWGSLRLGMARACHDEQDYIVTTDADNTFDLTQIPGQVRLMIEGQAVGAVATSRFMPGSIRNIHSFGHEMESRHFYPYAVENVLGVDQLSGHDLQCGQKAFRREVLAAHVPHMVTNTFMGDTELLTMLALSGQEIRSVPVSVFLVGPRESSVPENVDEYRRQLRSIAAARDAHIDLYAAAGVDVPGVTVADCAAAFGDITPAQVEVARAQEEQEYLRMASSARVDVEPADVDRKAKPGAAFSDVAPTRAKKERNLAGDIVIGADGRARIKEGQEAGKIVTGLVNLMNRNPGQCEKIMGLLQGGVTIRVRRGQRNLAETSPGGRVIHISEFLARQFTKEEDVKPPIAFLDKVVQANEAVHREIHPHLKAERPLREDFAVEVLATIEQVKGAKQLSDYAKTGTKRWVNSLRLKKGARTSVEAFFELVDSFESTDDIYTWDGIARIAGYVAGNNADFERYGQDRYSKSLPDIVVNNARQIAKRIKTDTPAFLAKVDSRAKTLDYRLQADIALFEDFYPEEGLTQEEFKAQVAASPDGYVVESLIGGRGSRFIGGGQVSKILFPIGGKPIALWGIEAAQELGMPVVAVCGNEQSPDVSEAESAKRVVATLDEHNRNIRYVTSYDATAGTGYGTIHAMRVLPGFQGTLISLVGDAPRVNKRLLRKIQDAHSPPSATGRQVACTIVTAEATDIPYNYGRIIKRQDGTVDQIIEQGPIYEIIRRGGGIVELEGRTLKNLTPPPGPQAGESEAAYKERLLEQGGAIRLADGTIKTGMELHHTRWWNSGMYAFNAPLLWETLGAVELNQNRQEFLVTDVVEKFNGARHEVRAVEVDEHELEAVNSVTDLRLLLGHWIGDAKEELERLDFSEQQIERILRLTADIEPEKDIRAEVARIRQLERDLPRAKRSDPATLKEAFTMNKQFEALHAIIETTREMTEREVPDAASILMAHLPQSARRSGNAEEFASDVRVFAYQAVIAARAEAVAQRVCAELEGPLYLTDIRNSRGEIVVPGIQTIIDVMLESEGFARPGAGGHFLTDAQVGALFRRMMEADGNWASETVPYRLYDEGEKKTIRRARYYNKLARAVLHDGKSTLNQKELKYIFDNLDKNTIARFLLIYLRAYEGNGNPALWAKIRKYGDERAKQARLSDEAAATWDDVKRTRIDKRTMMEIGNPYKNPFGDPAAIDYKKLHEAVWGRVEVGGKKVAVLSVSGIREKFAAFFGDYPLFDVPTHPFVTGTEPTLAGMVHAATQARLIIEMLKDPEEFANKIPKSVIKARDEAEQEARWQKTKEDFMALLQETQEKKTYGRTRDQLCIRIYTDSRPTSPALADVYSRMLLQLGVKVEYGGVASVTTAAVDAKENAEVDAVVYISASHNPPGDNGLKLFVGDGRVLPPQVGNPYIFILRQELQEQNNTAEVVRKVSEAPASSVAALYRDIPRVKNEAVALEGIYRDKVITGKATKDEADPIIERIKAFVKEKRLAVILDPNGGAREDKAYFERLGFKVYVINERKLYDMNHELCPSTGAVEETDEELSELNATAVEEGYTVIGSFHYDTDGDRRNFRPTSGDGDFMLRPDMAQVCFAMDVINYVLDAKKKDPDKIVGVACNGPTSVLLEELAERFGFVLIRTQTGEANVVNGMELLAGKTKEKMTWADVKRAADRGEMELIIPDALRERFKAKRYDKQNVDVVVAGEGSNGSDFTPELLVRDPLHTIKMLINFLDPEEGPERMQDFLRALDREGEFDASLWTTSDGMAEIAGRVINALPKSITSDFFTIGGEGMIVNPPVGLPGVVKDKFDSVFESEYQQRTFARLAEIWGVEPGQLSCEFVNYEDVARLRKGNRSPEADVGLQPGGGGYKVNFYLNVDGKEVPIAWIWFRDSLTETGLTRAGASVVFPGALKEVEGPQQDRIVMESYAFLKATLGEAVQAAVGEAVGTVLAADADRPGEENYASLRQYAETLPKGREDFDNIKSGLDKFMQGMVTRIKNIRAAGKLCSPAVIAQARLAYRAGLFEPYNGFLAEQMKYATDAGAQNIAQLIARYQSEREGIAVAMAKEDDLHGGGPGGIAAGPGMGGRPIEIVRDYASRDHKRRLEKAHEQERSRIVKSGMEVVIPKTYFERFGDSIKAQIPEGSDIIIVETEDKAVSYALDADPKKAAKRIVLLKDKVLDETQRKGVQCRVLELENLDFLHMAAAIDFGRAVLVGHQTSMETFYELLKHEPMPEELLETLRMSRGVISMELPRIETELIKGLEALQEEYAAFITSA